MSTHQSVVLCENCKTEKMEYIVDFQGLYGLDNKLIIKEFATLCIQNEHYTQHIFDSPYDWYLLPAKIKSTNCWLHRNYHGLHWLHEGLSYDLIKEHITATVFDATLIFVKGLEKKIFLQQLLQKPINIIDMMEIDCPRLKMLDYENNVKCSFHENLDKKFNCAFNNVKKLYSWIKNEE